MSSLWSRIKLATAVLCGCNLPYNLTAVRYKGFYFCSPKSAAEYSYMFSILEEAHEVIDHWDRDELLYFISQLLSGKISNDEFIEEVNELIAENVNPEQ